MKIIASLSLLLIASVSLAQTKLSELPQPVATQSTPKISELLATGFEMKAMSYLPNAIVYVLQRGTNAFICESDKNGQTRACIAIK